MSYEDPPDYDAPNYVVLRSYRRTACKEHECNGCSDIISVGQVYRADVVKDYDDDSFVVYKIHSPICPRWIKDDVTSNTL